MSWRVDHLPTPSANLVTTWHDTKESAMAEEDRLRGQGIRHVVAWWDAWGRVA